jgi:Double zinc ribbon
MSNTLDPRHDEVRSILRTVGPAMAGIGLLFMVIGVSSFFSSMNSFEPPKYFWCMFVGMPLLGLGVMITKLGYFGAFARYMAGEVAPVGKDMTNYMVAGTKDSIRDVATAVGEGYSAGSGTRSGRASRCPTCSADHDASANFCDRCGTPLRTTKHCEKCGELNDVDARFCDHCGSAVS